MRCRGKNRGIQLLNFYLKKWKYFDINIAYLSEVEIIQMKILYASLKNLSETEIKFLSDKYRFTESKVLNNPIAAELTGIPLGRYETKLREIQMKLIPYFLENEQRLKEELIEAVNSEIKLRRKN